MTGVQTCALPILAREPGGGAGAARLHAADICYAGQGYTLEVPLRLGAADPMALLYEDFLAAHDRVHGHATRNPARIVNLRAVHRAGGEAGDDGAPFAAEPGDPVKGRRRIRVAGHGQPLEATVLDRARMAPGMAFPGPAIVEQEDTTTLVEPGWRGRVDASEIGRAHV